MSGWGSGGDDDAWVDVARGAEVPGVRLEPRHDRGAGQGRDARVLRSVPRGGEVFARQVQVQGRDVRGHRRGERRAGAAQQVAPSAGRVEQQRLMSLISDKAARRITWYFGYTRRPASSGSSRFVRSSSFFSARAQFEGVPMLLPLDMSSSIPRARSRWADRREPRTTSSPRSPPSFRPYPRARARRRRPRRGRYAWRRWT